MLVSEKTETMNEAMEKGRVQDMWLIIIHKTTVTNCIPPQTEEKNKVVTNV